MEPMLNRRYFFLGSLGLAAACSRNDPEPSAASSASLELSDFEPRSALVTPKTAVERASSPAIDVHAHVFWSTGLAKLDDPDAKPLIPPDEQYAEIIRWMDELNLETLINLNSGWGDELALAIDSFTGVGAGRFTACTEPAWVRVSEPDYPAWQADELGRAKSAGAVGLKVLKVLGLFLREEGKLVAVDDSRFDPMWEAAGELGLPVFIHTADPDAFFTPIDRHNERWEELAAHPDWSFYGSDFPSKAELIAARDRVIERHPRTNFVCLHVGNQSENLAEVGARLDRFPNMYVETGARLGELGRQPRASRRFFEAYQDRILFGTDAVPLPEGEKYPQQTLVPDMYQRYFRFFETEDEYFDYSPAPTPPQGRWKIYGIGLPEAIQRKVYRENAARLLTL